MSRYPARVAVASLLLLPLPMASLLGSEAEDAAYRLGARLGGVLAGSACGEAPEGHLVWEPLSADAASPSSVDDLTFIDAPLGTGPLALPEPSPKRVEGRRARPSPPNLHVTAERLLAVIATGLRPSGRAVAAAGGRPAGVRVEGVSAMGLGVAEGDILVSVSGVPVASAGEVVALVLAARAREAPVLVGRLYRGRASYALSVEMPYLEVGAAAPADSVAKAAPIPRHAERGTSASRTCRASSCPGTSSP